MVLGAEPAAAGGWRTLFRLLRPGGRFILHVHNRWFNAWDRSGRAWLLRDWLRSWMGGGAAIA